MAHKKKKHLETVNVCWHYSNGVCPFGEHCWFKHEIKESKNESNTQTMKCNICEKILMGKNSYMIHRREEHGEKTEICKLFLKGNCTYHEKCWFAHKNSKIDKMMSNEKSNR